MRLIDADELYKFTEESMLKNPHKDGKLRVNHTNEHLHFLRLIMRSPYVAAEPVKHGRWIFDFSLDDSNLYKCSVCGRQEVLLAKESTSEYFPYCHCGAKMDLEDKK